MIQSVWGGLVCPVCPNRKPRHWDDSSAKQHVVAMAGKWRCTGNYTVDKNVARHVILGINMGWIEQA